MTASNSTVRTRTAACAAAAGALLLTAPAAPAQVPGRTSLNDANRRERIHAEYVLEVSKELRRVLDGWSDAWVRGDASGVVAHYAEDAVVHLPLRQAPAWGASDVQSHFADAFPVVDSVSVSLVNLDVSSRLAYVLGRYAYRVSRDVPRGGDTVDGSFLMVFRKQRGGWKIRSQLFHPADG